MIDWPELRRRVAQRLALDAADLATTRAEYDAASPTWAPLDPADLFHVWEHGRRAGEARALRLLAEEVNPSPTEDTPR